MKAMIFAAGIGSRLKPWTDLHPKALVEVDGTPMLGHVIARIKEAGITDITVNVHHFASQVIDYIKANNNFGLPEIKISDESDLLLDTGGALVKARTLLAGNEPVLIHNADILTDIDFNRLANAHKDTGAGATLLVEDRDSSRRLLFDADGRMHGWMDMRNGRLRPDALTTAQGLKPLAFGGIHIISQDTLDDIAAYATKTGREVFSIIDYYVDSCAERNIHAFVKPEQSVWFDVGNPATLERAREYFSTHR